MLALLFGASTSSAASVILLLLVLLHSPCAMVALDNGLSLTPVMGWNAWWDLTALDQKGLNESMVRWTADTLLQLRLDKLGYKFVNLDDGFMKSQDAHSVLQPDPATFPSGMRNLSDYIHGRRLRFGVL